jgi:hypothetical protein
MKKFTENILKFFVVLISLSAAALIFKLSKNWWLPALFSYNFSIIAGYVLMGPVAAGVLLALAVAADSIVLLKALAAKISLLPFMIEAVMFAAAYLLVKRWCDFNSYQIFTAQDSLKALEGGHNALLKEEMNLKAGIDANRAKLEKYKKLQEIHDGLRDHNMFAGKMRHILRNVISIFHQEKSIVLFMIKDGTFLRAEATKDDDMLVGEPDKESLYLKNFDEWIIHNKKSIIISDMHKEVRFKSAENDRMKSLIAVPVFIGEEIAGVLRISSDKSGCFNQEDLRFLDLIAEMTGKILKEEVANAK